MRIYTRTGDDGTTGLFGGGRVRKDSPRVAACGDVDELNAALGLARCGVPPRGDLDALLARIQSELIDLGADLATPAGTKAETHVRRVAAPDARFMEEAIDRLEVELEPLRTFILPGGTPAAAHLHAARAICRRAERRIVALAAAETVGDGVLAYVNRLSDLLFVLGRVANRRAGAPEPRWTQGD